MKRFAYSSVLLALRPDIIKVLLTILVTAGPYILYAQPCVTEVCNEIDDDCDGLIDEGVQTEYFVDFDGDGYFNPYITILACTAPPGWYPDPGGFYDANDTDAYIGAGNGGAEVCNGIDDDGNGLIDTQDPGLVGYLFWYADSDNDGYGDPNTSVIACSQPSGYVPWPNDLDCDDTDPAVYPGAQEICNGIDDDCDGLAEQEICNGIDDDCDGLVDEDVNGLFPWYADADQDGYGDPASVVYSCSPPSGYVVDNGDCDDTNPAVNPGAQEICSNGIDDNCNGYEDNNAIGQSIWYLDADNDGFGSPDVYYSACDQPSGYVGTGTDCDDSNAASRPGANELQDGLDNDCDGLIDEDVSSISVDAGDCELVYLGYAPYQCVSLSVSSSGGATPYTFIWSNGATTQSISVCPEETTIYSVLVTDHNGSTAMDNVTVQVIDVRCGNNNNKVMVCHVPADNPENSQQICIAPSSVPDHLAHGDFLGICEAEDPCGDGIQYMVTEQVDAEIDAPRQVFSNAFMNEDEMSLMVRPNPVDDQLEVQTNLVPGTISLMDISGKVILQQVTNRHKNSIETVSLADGIYFIRLESGTHCYTKSVVIMH